MGRRNSRVPAGALTVVGSSVHCWPLEMTLQQSQCLTRHSCSMAAHMAESVGGMDCARWGPTCINKAYYNGYGCSTPFHCGLLLDAVIPFLAVITSHKCGPARFTWHLPSCCFLSARLCEAERSRVWGSWEPARQPSLIGRELSRSILLARIIK